MDRDHTTDQNSPKPCPELASEINNLLQIISGTSHQLESIAADNPRAQKYFEMLRTSVDRAAAAAARLADKPQEKSDKIIPHPDSRPPVRQTPRGPKKRILFVDDEQMLLVLTARILRDAGFEVVTARSGFECLDLIRSGGDRFDLVLLDFSMPLMDGQETFERIRALRPNQAVMLCTGHIQQERLDHMLADGLCGFMLKPLPSSVLVANIREVLQARALGLSPVSSGW